MTMKIRCAIFFYNLRDIGFNYIKRKGRTSNECAYFNLDKCKLRILSTLDQNGVYSCILFYFLTNSWRRIGNLDPSH